MSQPRYNQPQRPQRPQPAPAPAKTGPKVTGQINLWTTLQTVRDTASGATKTTRAMQVPGGVIINTCTRGAAYAAEALVFVPGLTLLRSSNAQPAQLVASV